MTLPAEEPPGGPWRATTLRALWRRLTATPVPEGRPRVVVLDGRGDAGKSTLAATLAGLTPGATVLHTDDLAWHEPLFGWDGLLVDLLGQVRTGRAVTFRPPAWTARGRPGAITVPEGAGVVVVEGSGAALAARAGLADAVVWVQADAGESERRGIARDVAQRVNGDLAEATRFWRGWSDAERPFFAGLRPWDLADVFVAGTETVPLGPGEVAVAERP